ncbi:sensor histidine kinase [Aureimonas jatrophae]|uniref:sensor histidine kinase n=1 Tax=Aureimonas jatrophae TaxID=1166073 RepID=UPI0017E944C4|nr:HAMP domain-containing sensor histidine kinase [Aureimonas jatrophae]MBB3949523.1 two-component system cell cycle sensor histidine kinase PleC [Aureimonas jatrophae]
MARERLVSSEGLPPSIEQDLLGRHVASVPLLAMLHITLLVLVCLVQWNDTGTLPLRWLAVGVASLLPSLAALVLFHARPALQPSIGRWPRLFQFALAVMGLPLIAWTLGPDCGTCVPGIGDGARFVLGLVWAIGVAFLAAHLAHAVASGLVPLAAASAVSLADGAVFPSDVFETATLLLVAALGLAAHRFRRSSIDALHHQVQREQLVAEVEIARTHFDEARARAEEASLAKSRFLATMSHELRTPLNAILGFSEVIMKEILGPLGNPTYKEYVGDIHTSGQHLLDLINEILDLSRIEAGRYTLNEEPVDLVTVAEASIAFVQLKADAKNISLVGEFERDLPQLWGDPRSLRQVTLNLLSNAVKFTPPNGRILLRVGWTAGGGQYVSIRDTGPGIPSHEIPIVLSSFGQGAAAIKSAEQGTGLGLPIVRALVELHNGTFELHSAVGKGTEAIAIFPHSRVLEVMPAMTELG